MNPTFRILYAEDNAQDADLTRSHFLEHATEFELDIAQTGKACLDLLFESEYDLLLLDNYLPDMEGLDVLRTLARSSVRVPTVLVTGAGDEDLVVKALRLGASNYVSKLGKYLEILPELMRGAIEEHRLKQRRGLPSVGKWRVLYVEHHAMDIELTLRHFAEAAPNIELKVIRSCAEALAYLGRSPACDAALVDLRMPDQSGLDFVREAKQRDLLLPPFIMITGQGDEAAALASLKLGAANYVVKRPGYLDQLTYTVERAIDHDQVERLNAQLQAELLERKRVQEELRLRNLILSTQQEASIDGILVVDVSGKIISFNQRFTDMWSVPAHVMQAGSDERVLQLAMDKTVDPEQFIKKVKYLYATPNEKSHDDIALKDGRTFERYSAPMLDADGRNFGRVWYFRDITARKQAEAERERLEAQLRVSQKMEAIGALAGGVAHDFNNLLSVILMCTEFALDGVREGVSIDAELRDVNKAAERAVALTQQLLAFSRKQVLQPVVLDLNKIAVGVEKMLGRILGEDIGYVQVLAPELASIRADQGLIEQVLMNLVVNARDAMPDGGKLTIETSNFEIDEKYAAQLPGVAPGPYVVLAVTDTGHGMDEQTRVQIFEPFFTTKEQGKGTGLGLSTVYGIVKQSGGHISVHTVLGRGTTFEIYLPVARAVPVTPSKAPMKSIQSAGNETIIVVEDEDALRKVARRALEGAGYKVLTAADGQEAIVACARHAGDVHLLVTDVVMPRMGGKTLAQELAKLRPNLKVLYVSGYVDDTIVHHGVLVEGIHFLSKPFTAVDLVRKVREVLDAGVIDPATG